MRKLLTVVFLLSLPLAAATIDLQSLDTDLVPGQALTVDVVLSNNGEDEWITSFGFDVLLSTLDRLTLTDVTINDVFFESLSASDVGVFGVSKTLFAPTGSPIALAKLHITAGPDAGPVLLSVQGPVNPLLQPNSGVHIVRLDTNSNPATYAHGITASLQFNVAAVPEGSTLSLVLGGGLLMVGAAHRRRRSG